MKKLLLLGGSAQQVIAIKKAKNLGYYTILCDYLQDNPGQYEADIFYCVSTTDKDAILEVAKKENIDGIIAYSSDPAAPTAAYVAEKMGLPGIPYKTAETFCNKNLFRRFLKKNGFNVPACIEFGENDVSSVVEKLQFPIIVKPTDSSGSKGVTVLGSIQQFESARDYAAQISRNGILLAEEFIKRDHPDVIEAEIFVVDGEVKIWGLMNSIRDKTTNPLLPAGYTYPLNISERRIELVKEEIVRLVKCSEVKYGAFNIEMIITKDNKLYFLDAGPRNGGNELPEYISLIAGGDIVEETIDSAMGNYGHMSSITLNGIDNGYWGMFVLHSNRPGVFDRIEYVKEASNYLIRESYFIQKGTHIGAFEISRDAIGLAIFRFPDVHTRDLIMNDFTGKYIKVILQ